jgi:hypothetical protein
MGMLPDEIKPALQGGETPEIVIELKPRSIAEASQHGDVLGRRRQVTVEPERVSGAF